MATDLYIISYLFQWYISGSAENDGSVTLWKTDPVRSDVNVTGNCSITILQDLQEQNSTCK